MPRLRSNSRPEHERGPDHRPVRLGPGRHPGLHVAGHRHRPAAQRPADAGERDGRGRPRRRHAAAGRWVGGRGRRRQSNALVAKTVTADYPGIAAADYTISYRCLIGADPTTGAPLISRDIPAVCDPHHALGHNPPVAADFFGAGKTSRLVCDPFLGDICNAVVVEGATTTQFSLRSGVGVTSGSTGTVTSAACNGPCGEPPQVPVDVVLILDRTLSMVHRAGTTLSWLRRRKPS